MRFWPIITAIVVTLVSSCQAVGIDIENDEVITEDEFSVERSWFEYLCSEKLGGRYSGSKGIEAAADYISAIIGYSDSLHIDSFLSPKCGMKNIVFHVEGEKDSVIVIGAHYDAFGYINKTPLPGADDNLSGVVVLLKMIKQIQRMGRTPSYSMAFCFFDGEEVGRYGSCHFVKSYSRPIKLYINVDTCGSEKDYDLTVSYNSQYPFLRESFSLLPNRIGAVPIMEYEPLVYTTDCEPFAKANIPFIAIGPSKVPYYLHSINDDVTHISFSRLDTISKELVTLFF